MSLYSKNFEKSFQLNGGHAGEQTLKALEPELKKLKNAGLTGRQAGLVLAAQSKLQRQIDMQSELLS